MHALCSSVRSSLATLVALCAIAAPLAGCTDADAQEAGLQEALAPGAPVTAAVSGTLSCSLEYMNRSPFAVRPLVSFSKPMSEVAAAGVTASNGTYLLFANQYEPSGGSNLGFTVSAHRVSTGRDINYLVLPPQSPIPGYLFETATRITTVTVGGVAYTHLRTYCAMTP